MSIQKQRKLFAIAYVTLTNSAVTYGQERNFVCISYEERLVQTASILEKFDDIGCIKLEVLNVAVKLWEIAIYFNNGGSQTVELPGILDHSNESPFIDLEDESGIKMITFSVNALRLSEKTPLIWIWGM